MLLLRPRIACGNTVGCSWRLHFYHAPEQVKAARLTRLSIPRLRSFRCADCSVSDSDSDDTFSVLCARLCVMSDATASSEAGGAAKVCGRAVQPRELCPTPPQMEHLR